MDNELTEVYAFISAIAPFEQLNAHTIRQIVSHINICYLPKGEELPPQHIEKAHFYIVRKGALCYLSKQNELLGKYGEGDICTVFCYPHMHEAITVKTEEDCLLYAIEKQKLLGCIIEHPEIFRFFEHSADQRLRHQVDKLQEQAIVNSSLTNTAIEQLYHAPVVTISAEASIAETAQKMTELGYSCLVIVDNHQAIKGIVTDKDFRRRFAAKSLSPDQPVSAIMSTEITTLDLKHSAFDALIVMNRHHIHHLPITENGQLKGMLTITDLMHFEGQNAINLTSLIQKAKSIEELAELSKLLPQLQLKMTALGTTGEQVAKAISLVSMSLTIRLIELAEQQLGAAPVPYAWLAAGSQARQEQLAHSDQDNALIIDDAMQPEHQAWFKNLAHFVCDGLAQCGFEYCPGNVMATNDKWRQTEASWHRYFKQWVDEPEPKALMHASIFFDLTTVYGDKSLFNRVQHQLLTRTQQSSLFLAYLSKNALIHKPPLGFFRDFVLISNGKNKRKMDIKHNGIAPIVDLARIYALAEGISSVNTIERLKLAGGTKSLTRTSAASLIDAYYFLTSLRLNHQGRQLQQGQPADSYVAPKEISRLEREHLKDAFKVIKTLQDNRQTVYS